MNQIIFSSDTNKGICDVVDCTNTATNDIAVPVGIYGIMRLQVCQNCVGKFNPIVEKMSSDMLACQDLEEVYK